MRGCIARSEFEDDLSRIKFGYNAARIGVEDGTEFVDELQSRMKSLVLWTVLGYLNLVEDKRQNVYVQLSTLNDAGTRQLFL